MKASRNVFFKKQVNKNSKKMQGFHMKYSNNPKVLIKVKKLMVITLEISAKYAKKF